VPVVVPADPVRSLTRLDPRAVPEVVVVVGLTVVPPAPVVLPVVPPADLVPFLASPLSRLLKRPPVGVVVVPVGRVVPVALPLWGAVAVAPPKRLVRKLPLPRPPAAELLRVAAVCSGRQTCASETVQTTPACV
jgi:hypothetical protein